MTVDRIIARLGGDEKAALLLGVSRRLINHWKQHGIPAKRAKQISLVSTLVGHPVPLTAVLDATPEGGL